MAPDLDLDPNEADADYIESGVGSDRDAILDQCFHSLRKVWFMEPSLMPKHENALIVKAIQTATDNAKKVIDNWPFNNRARQATITQEITEAVAGRGALDVDAHFNNTNINLMVCILA